MQYNGLEYSKLPMYSKVRPNKVAQKNVPVNLCNRIFSQYKQIWLLEENLNHVKRIQHSIYGVQEQLFIDIEFFSNNNNGNSTGKS
jgi:hypothetical protein